MLAKPEDFGEIPCHREAFSLCQTHWGCMSRKLVGEENQVMCAWVGLGHGSHKCSSSHSSHSYLLGSQQTFFETDIT